MIEATLDTRDLDRASRVMAKAPETFVEQMRLANMESSAALVKRIKEGKLRGQVLNRITGTLLRSWAAKVPPKFAGDGWLGGAGSNLDYAAFHEFGYKGAIAVRAHERQSRRTRTASGNFRRRKPGSPTHHVRAYTRHLDYKGRPYARPALEEIRDKVREIHEARIRKAEEKLGGTA